MGRLRPVGERGSASFQRAKCEVARAREPRQDALDLGQHPPQERVVGLCEERRALRAGQHDVEQLSARRPPAVLVPLDADGRDHAALPPREEATERWIDVRVSKGVSALRVEVADTGPGVPPEMGAAFFDLYARSSTAQPGLGLGLASAKRLVDAHGGLIGYRARHGEARRPEGDHSVILASRALIDTRHRRASSAPTRNSRTRRSACGWKPARSGATSLRSTRARRQRREGRARARRSRSARQPTTTSASSTTRVFIEFEIRQCFSAFSRIRLARST